MKNLLTLTLAFSLSSLLALNPSKEYAFHPEDLGLNYKEWKVMTDDNFEILAWRIAPAKGMSSQTVIICDDGDGNMADNFDIAGLFLGANFNVVMFDYRGYGQSQAARVNPNMYLMPNFSKDIDAVINEVKKIDAKQVITLYGLGMGGGLAIGVGCNNIKVRRVVADAPYPDLETVKNRLKEVKEKDVIIPPGAEKTLYEPKFALESKGQHIEAVMLIVGGADKVVTQADMQTLTTLRKKTSDLYVVPGVENDKNFTSNKNEYFNRIKAFLAKSYQ
jgi:alpha-beta hydrolase superfamily lysophospholipase